VIGLDTNVLLRLFDSTDPMQSAQSHALVRTQGVGGCYLNAIVLSEFAWTLARSYNESREVVAAHLASLLAAPEFVVGHSEEASRALGRYLSGRADFPDYFLAEINKTAGCPYTSTFDVDALKSGDPFSAVPASQ
jgi:predicted nucleic-acid-binding protein